MTQTVLTTVASVVLVAYAMSGEGRAAVSFNDLVGTGEDRGRD